MKKIYMLIIAGLAILGLSGCGSSSKSPSLPKIKTSKEFKFEGSKLTLTQFVTPDIKYHTQEELKDILNDKLTTLMKTNKLLSKNDTDNSLLIQVNYERRFVGDKTPLPSDALGYPNFSYTITVLDNDKKISEIKKDKLTYQGGFSMNLQVMAAALRDKKYEVQFLEALANTIFEDIKNIELKE